MRRRADRPLEIAPATVLDYRELARRRLPRQLFDYVDGGAYEEHTMRANTADLERILLRQVVMRDVSERDPAVEVLGEKLAMPVVLAPVGLGGMLAPRAEVQAARAAEAAGVPFVESTVSICGIEEVARATSRPPWFQLYVMRDRGYAAELMARAGAAGCPVLVLTVDLAVVGARHRDTRNAVVGENLPAGARIRRALDLISHPRWIRSVAIGGKPLTFGNLEEGVLDPQDARQAAEVGVDGIVVSNHGGRQLDSAPSTARALPEVVDAVGGRVEVLADGGVRTGLDAFKMVALGARAVLVGRAWAWAVAARGEAGVRHVLDVLRADLDVAMALTGHTSLDAVDRSALHGPAEIAEP